MLDFSKLYSLLLANFHEDSIHLLPELDSTNTFLVNGLMNKTFKNELLPQVCVANIQLNGHGQRQRKWLSTDHSFKFSFSLRINYSIQLLSSLSCLVAVTLAKNLRIYFPETDIRIKWPNDLYIDCGKLAGILIESVSISENSTTLVIGIGINDFEVLDYSDKLDTQFSGLDLQNSNPEVMLSNLLSNIVSTLSTFNFTPSSKDIDALINDYVKYDYFQPFQPVIVYDTDSPREGIYRGIDQGGACLIDFSGDLQKFITGMVSIRPK